MTADERIESLVSSFGQTISDLPKVADNCWCGTVYKSSHLISAKKEALAFVMDEWRDYDGYPEIRYEVEEVLLDYICHLCDVIDRMEAALETAMRWMGCEMCGRSGSCQKVTDCEVDNGFIRDCDDFRIEDWFLEGV